MAYAWGETKKPRAEIWIYVGVLRFSRKAQQPGPSDLVHAVTYRYLGRKKNQSQASPKGGVEA